MLLSSVVFAGAWWAAYVVLHILLVRTVRPRLYVGLSLKLFLLMLVAFAAVVRSMGSLQGFAFVNSLLVFGSLWLLYLQFTFIVMRSVSVRTMVEIERAPTRAVTPEQMDRLYTTEQMFAQRIDSLVANRYLEATNGHLRLTPRGAALVRLFLVVRRILNVRVYG